MSLNLGFSNGTDTTTTNALDGKATGDINMEGFQISHPRYPSDGTHVTCRDYVTGEFLAKRDKLKGTATGDIDMGVYGITQSKKATDDNHLINKKYATEKFAKKENYRLNATMVWYYQATGGTPEALNSNTYPMVPVSKDTMIRILCHSFDTDGVVPDNVVQVAYRLYYVTYKDTQGSELLGTLTLGNADRHYSGHWSIPVNHDFYVKDTISAQQATNKPSVGYIYPTITGLTSGNESCLTVAFYEPV